VSNVFHSWVVKRQPENAQAHFALSYVLRYTAMLEESARQCETALALDPGDYGFRSCAWALAPLGKTERAMDFVRLDAGSEWAASATPSILLRDGKMEEARESVKRMSLDDRDRFRLCEVLSGTRKSGSRQRDEGRTSLTSAIGCLKKGGCGVHNSIILALVRAS
jgi:hypothetical protein